MPYADVEKFSRTSKQTGLPWQAEQRLIFRRDTKPTSKRSFGFTWLSFTAIATGFCRERLLASANMIRNSCSTSNGAHKTAQGFPQIHIRNPNIGPRFLNQLPTLLSKPKPYILNRETPNSQIPPVIPSQATSLAADVANARSEAVGVCLCC